MATTTTTRKPKIKAWVIDGAVERINAGELTIETLREKNPALAAKVERELAKQAREPEAGSAKAIVRQLEAAAARCETVDAVEPTPKQLWYLACLLESKGGLAQWSEPLNSSYVLTRRRASEMIDLLKNS